MDPLARSICGTARGKVKHSSGNRRVPRIQALGRGSGRLPVIASEESTSSPTSFFSSASHPGRAGPDTPGTIFVAF